METILKADHLAISFGSNHVLKDINFELGRNEILGIIGPNGAGKTVMLNIITGILKPTSGRLYFEGNDITNMKITDRAKNGIGRTFQVPRAFEKMSAYENIMTGAIFGAGMSQHEARDKAEEVLELIGMADKADIDAGQLALLDRKRLEIGIALASQPKILLFDEVAGGLTESEIDDILKIVKVLKESGYSIIWIEHVIQTMLHGTDRVLLLADGRDIITGDPHEVMASEEVEKVYLGTRKKNGK